MYTNDHLSCLYLNSHLSGSLFKSGPLDKLSNCPSRRALKLVMFRSEICKVKYKTINYFLLTIFIDTNTQKSDNNKEYRGHAYCVKIEINSSWELEKFKVVYTCYIMEITLFFIWFIITILSTVPCSLYG